MKTTQPSNLNQTVHSKEDDRCEWCGSPRQMLLPLKKPFCLVCDTEASHPQYSNPERVKRQHAVAPPAFPATIRSLTKQIPDKERRKERQKIYSILLNQLIQT